MAMLLEYLGQEKLKLLPMIQLPFVLLPGTTIRTRPNHYYLYEYKINIQLFMTKTNLTFDIQML